MKRTLLTIAAVIALVALCAAPAFAEGYNSDSIISGTTNGGQGQYVRTVTEAGQIQAFSGPHGGYTTTTNKCQDCHSTHYAYGSYKLLRADEAAAACDYCHGGGGGSSVNIMMDNQYRAGEFDPYGDDGLHNDDPTENVNPAAITDPLGIENAANAGYGTGHTLGYKGLAPVDIEPAFSDPTDGLACFSCHSPHGNSARVLGAFGTPSRPAGDGEITTLKGVSFMASSFWGLQEKMMIEFDFGDFNAFTGAGLPQNSYINIPNDLSTLPFDFDGSSPIKWSDEASATEIGAAVEAFAGSEIAAVGPAFGAWMTAPAGPTAPADADMMAWRMTPANFAGDADGDGYAEVSDAGVGSLMALFAPAGDMDLVNLFIAWKVYWGTDVKGGNIDTAFMNMGDFQAFDQPGYMGWSPIDMPELEVWHKPLFPAGTFLLLKNPDSGDDYTMAEGGVNEWGFPSPDMKVVDSNGADNIAGNADDVLANEANGKKTAIDWKFPIGPAATWGPFFSTGTNVRFPLQFPWAPQGVAMENEFCTSCHDGAAGMAVQKAKVYNSTEATYVVAYSHDSNARGCARAQYLNTEQTDENNFGPHCANCHTGASGCRTCHSADGENWEAYGRSAFTTDPANAWYEGVSTFVGPKSVRTSAVNAVGGACLDGGFSYPHRTLGANMLKDSIYGVNFDGTVASVGTTRTLNGVAAYQALSTDLESFFTTGESFEASGVIDGAPVENLDSVCLDCHGNATYWNGDASDEITFTSMDPLHDPADAQVWTVEGWQLLLKGLP